MAEVWRKCSSCKNDIMTGQKYYVCSVSTCQGRVTNYAFCGVNCWDAHLPIERHRGDSAGAIERKAPMVPDAQAPAPAAAAEGQRRIVRAGGPAGGAATQGSKEDEVLVVVTKVRKYIADRSGMNTSAGLYDILTEKVKRICDLAIEEARAQGRKTVMDRDVH
jgi:hypothetical protein